VLGYEYDIDSHVKIGQLDQALDGRQSKISYWYEGVYKTRYFVDNVERFLKENPDHWTSTDILNR
jgi:hypothetical protein